MTEVSKMTDQQLNRALAELMGYTIGNHKGENGRTLYFLIRPSGKKEMYNGSADEAFAWDAPRYCTDPAASLEVQAAAIDKDAEEYVFTLMMIVRGTPHKDKRMLPPEMAAQLLTATPRQRAEAAYMTLRGEGK
jgi:hypothetical protein